MTKITMTDWVVFALQRELDTLTFNDEFFEMIMLPHQQRVVDERNELVEKIEKLNKFIDYKNPLWKQIDPDEKDRLIQQYRHMIKYAEVLDARIAAFAE